MASIKIHEGKDIFTALSHTQSKPDNKTKRLSPESVPHTGSDTMRHTTRCRSSTPSPSPRNTGRRSTPSNRMASSRRVTLARASREPRSEAEERVDCAISRVISKVNWLTYPEGGDRYRTL